MTIKEKTAAQNKRKFLKLVRKMMLNWDFEDNRQSSSLYPIIRFAHEQEVEMKTSKKGSTSLVKNSEKSS